MKKTLFFFFLFSFFLLNAQSFRSYYDDKFNDKLIYLHALVNYDIHPVWKYQWEEHLLSRNGVMLSFGSVETQDLQTLLHLNINEPLSRGLTFTYRGRWFESQITHTPLRYGYLGLDQKIYGGFSAFLSANPSFDKEETDLRAGFRMTDSLRTNYLSFAFVYEDFTYDEKNDRGGSSSRTPKGFNWTARLSGNGFTFYSEGDVSSGFKRRFNDPEKSPLETYHEQKTGRIAAKFYYTPSADLFYLLGYSQYSFDEGKRFYDSSFSYDFSNRFHTIYLEHIRPLAPDLAIRLSGRYVIQDSRSAGYRNFRYDRREIMPALFLEYTSGCSVWELGYMESVFDWESEAVPSESSFSKDGAIEKVKLGWTCRFSDLSHMQISLSHVFSFFGFGGANIQFVHNF